MKHPVAVIAVTLAALTATTVAFAQTTFNRPIRLIVPYSPGGGTDTLARLFAPLIGDTFGQTVVVDNRPGAGSIIGTEMIARATPDGHTIGMVDSAFLTNPGLRKLPYDTLRDFAPIAHVRAAPLVLLVHTSLPPQSLAELVAYAKARPGKLSYGSAGNGSGIHLAGEQLRLATGIDVVHVPYKGGGPVVVALLGNQITMAFTSIGIARPHVAGGRLRPLATTSLKRTAVMPDVPTFTEAGLPGVNSVTHNGLLAPAKTPADVIHRMNTVVANALKGRELEKKLPDLGYEAAGGTPQDFGTLIRTEVAKWRKLTAEAGIHID